MEFREGMFGIGLRVTAIYFTGVWYWGLGYILDGIENIMYMDDLLIYASQTIDNKDHSFILQEPKQIVRRVVNPFIWTLVKE